MGGDRARCLARMRRAALTVVLCAATLAGRARAEPHWCGETPAPGPSRSAGAPSRGSLAGAVRLRDSDAVRVLPRRHRARCLDWGTERLVRALERAGREVRQQHPDSPPLGVGDIGRARGGPVRPFSRSHQAGRDADLAFYMLDKDGRAHAAEDLVAFGPRGVARDGSGRRLDVERTWTLVAALLRDREVDVRWVFVSEDIRRALLDEARRRKAAPRLLRRAAEVLHRPSDAPAHDDHIHLRIRCSAAESARGCR